MKVSFGSDKKPCNFCLNVAQFWNVYHEMCRETKLKLKVRADSNDDFGWKSLNFEAILVLSQLKIKLYHCMFLRALEVQCYDLDFSIY